MTNEEAKVFGKMWLDMNEDAYNKLQRGLALTVKESWDLYKYIEALKQRPCEDCISRAYIEPIVEELENICINGDEHILSLLSDIKNAPSVTPQPKIGRWEKVFDEHSYWYKCSCCGEKIPKNFWGNDYFSSYCPECGAKMEGEEGEKDGSD